MKKAREVIADVLDASNLTPPDETGDYYAGNILESLTAAGFVILPREPDEEAKLVGARILRDSASQPNYTERANGFYRAMVQHYESKGEAE